MSLHVPEQFRVRNGRMASTRANGNNGAFFVPNRVAKGRDRAMPLHVIVSDGLAAEGLSAEQQGWQHVSVSLPGRCPTWEEMAYIKDLFFDAEDCVVQFHPPRSDYVNNHPYCLHLWRYIAGELPRPSSALVGDPTLGTLRMRL